jgi:hypothetical protein
MNAVERNLRTYLSPASHIVYTERIKNFVGRDVELIAIRREIAALQQRGGYLFVTAPIGAGTSSTIAKFIEQDGIDKTAAFFIHHTTTAADQLKILQHLIAQLLLKHGRALKTTDYLWPEAQLHHLIPAFLKLLQELSRLQHQEMIAIDGLYQVNPSVNQSDTLHFLPDMLPPGIVCVISMPSDATRQSLTRLTTPQIYQLPPLSQWDVAAILASQSIHLSRAHARELDAAVQGNAFELSLFLEELKHMDSERCYSHTPSSCRPPSETDHWAHNRASGERATLG